MGTVERKSLSALGGIAPDSYAVTGGLWGIPSAKQERPALVSASGSAGRIPRRRKAVHARIVAVAVAAAVVATFWVANGRAQDQAVFGHSHV